MDVFYIVLALVLVHAGLVCIRQSMALGRRARLAKRLSRYTRQGGR